MGAPTQVVVADSDSTRTVARHPRRDQVGAPLQLQREAPRRTGRLPAGTVVGLGSKKLVL